MNLPTKESILFALIHFETFENIRDDLIELYEIVYNNYPEVQEYYSQYSNSELRDTVGEKAVESRQYDPYERVNEVRDFLQGMFKFVVVVLAILFLIGQISGVALLVAVSRYSLRVTETISGFLIALILGGSWFVSILAAIVFVLPYVMGFSTFVVQSFNKRLAIGVEAHVERRRPRIVAYLLWNESLYGPTAMRLLSVCGILKVLSAIPGWNPYGHILMVSKNHITAVIEEETWFGAARSVFKSYMRWE